MNHDWRDCRPVMPPSASEYLTELIRTAALRVWDRLSRDERRSYHSYVCLGQHTPRNRVKMQVLYDAVRGQALLDQARHEESARATLNAVQKAGFEIVTLEAGETVTLAVMRVADSVRLGDDPSPLVARRRLIVACSQCGQNCWLDPLCHGPATPVPVCLRCVDPHLGSLLADIIARRARSFPSADNDFGGHEGGDHKERA